MVSKAATKTGRLRTQYPAYWRN